jgi:4-methylaminobutanoate oxidase (formaldehyde-forming)
MGNVYRYYGSDLTLLDNPYEAGLGFCVNRDKWPSINREIARRLRTLAIGGSDYLPIYGGEAVTLDGRVVGRLRSCGYGFTVMKNLAYSYLPVALKPGAEVEVEIFGARTPARVVADSLLAKNAVATS